MTTKILTNKEFAKTDEAFRNTCAVVGISVSTRQASKFRRGLGVAYTYMVAHRHRGDPCIYCETPHDKVKPGPCPAKGE